MAQIHIPQVTHHDLDIKAVKLTGLRIVWNPQCADLITIVQCLFDDISTRSTGSTGYQYFIQTHCFLLFRYLVKDVKLTRGSVATLLSASWILPGNILPPIHIMG